ncbi:hypothetical protein [Labilibacter marinus]|uniref:hypothetical protein n=1 Tax=Labilibacter marinus TaxID=1477105 RepID=UPI0008343D30|nr:hypothetical protein [Labilibacter marinus]
MALLFVLKVMNIGATIIFVFLLSAVLSLIYFALGFAILNDNTFKDPFKKDSISNIQMVLSIAYGIAFSTILVGGFFNLLSIPGVMGQVIFGMGLLVILTLIFIFTQTKYSAEFKKNAIPRIVIFLIFGTILLVKPPSFFFKIQHRNNPEFIEAVMKAKANPQDSLLWQEVERLEREMN